MANQEEFDLNLQEHLDLSTGVKRAANNMARIGIGGYLRQIRQMAEDQRWDNPHIGSMVQDTAHYSSFWYTFSNYKIGTACRPGYNTVQ